MGWDAHKNLAVSTVATAPSPASSGLSLVVASGHGARFPAAPFNATVWPTGSSPDPGNAEVVRVSAVSTDTLTIARAQEGTSARTIVVGDLIAAGITTKTLTDIETELGVDPSGSFTDLVSRWAAQRRSVVNPAAGSMVVVPGVAGNAVSTFAIGTNSDHYMPVHCPDYLTFDRVLVEVTTASGSAGSVGRVGLYAAGTDWQPTGTLIEDFGTFTTDSTGVKTLTPAGGSRTLPGGRYLFAININGAGTTFRCLRGTLTPAMLMAALGSNPLLGIITSSRTHAVFPSTPVAWNFAQGNATGYNYGVFLRVTAEG